MSEQRTFRVNLEDDLVPNSAGDGRLRAHKPTSLLVLRLPTLRTRLAQGQVISRNPHGISLGRDSSGQFSTAKLKEYCPALCRSFAQAVRDRVDHIPILLSRHRAIS